MLGEKIKQLRKQSGMSQEKLAEKLCVSRQAVSKWETNQAMPDIDKIKDISILFGVSCDYLLCEEIKAETDKNRNYKSLAIAIIILLVISILVGIVNIVLIADGQLSLGQSVEPEPIEKTATKIVAIVVQSAILLATFCCSVLYVTKYLLPRFVSKNIRGKKNEEN